MEQTGVVVSIKNEYANVLINRLSACGGACETCKASCDIKPVEIMVKNDLGAVVGDKVEVESETGSILKILFILYFIPFLFLVGGVFLGTLIFKGISDNYELLSFAVGLVFLAVGYMLVKKIDSNYKDKHMLVVMKRIL